MKISILSCLLVMPLAAAPEAKPQKTVPFRSAPTHEQLVLKQQKIDQKDPMKKLATSGGEDPSKVNLPTNLLEDSDIICFGGMATLVPKRAVLAVPANHKERMTMQPGAKIIGWADFYTANRGWITTIEVTRVQAEGNQALPEETQKRIGKSMNLVVATCLGGPISVLPIKQPVTPANPAETVESKP